MNASRDDSEIICRAKSRLMRVLHVTEPQAYWLVRQMAMIRRCNKGEIARLLLIFPDEDCWEWLVPVLARLPASEDLPNARGNGSPADR